MTTCKKIDSDDLESHSSFVLGRSYQIFWLTREEYFMRNKDEVNPKTMSLTKESLTVTFLDIVQ